MRSFCRLSLLVPQPFGCANKQEPYIFVSVSAQGEVSCPSIAHFHICPMLLHVFTPNFALEAIICIGFLWIVIAHNASIFFGYLDTHFYGLWIHRLSFGFRHVPKPHIKYIKSKNIKNKEEIRTSDCFHNHWIIEVTQSIASFLVSTRSNLSFRN